MRERTGEAYELGEQLTVVGAQLAPGDPAPDFLLDRLDPDGSAITPVSLRDSADTVRLLNVVNSVDTPVCDSGVAEQPQPGTTARKYRWTLQNGIGDQSPTSAKADIGHFLAVVLTARVASAAI